MDNLEQVLFPVLKGLMDVTKGMAKCQSEEHETLITETKANSQKAQEMEAAIRTLSNSIDALSTPIGELIRAVNEANRLQQKQNAILMSYQESLAENTARVDVLNIALAAKTEDPGVKQLYEKLRRKDGA